MPELRRDPLTGSWVILSPERRMRPHFFSRTGDILATPENCPFCYGNESMTPAEIYAIRGKSAPPGQPDWKIRVVPNKYPALRVEGVVDRQPDGFYDRMNGIGAHEVVIETPLHNAHMGDLSVDETTEIFLAFKRRILDLKRDFRFKYIQVFKNHGRGAGATIPHPHSQIVALPVAPLRLQKILESSREHFLAKERCLICDIVRHELEHHKRVLLESNEFLAAAPYAPRLPFELAVYPRHHWSAYEDVDDHIIRSLAAVIREAVNRLNKTLKFPAYNLILHNAPFGVNCGEYFHWYWELMPIITGTGGYELGTFTYINSTSPEDSIRILSGV